MNQKFPVTGKGSIYSCCGPCACCADGQADELQITLDNNGVMPASNCDQTPLGGTYVLSNSGACCWEIAVPAWNCEWSYFDCSGTLQTVNVTSTMVITACVEASIISGVCESVWKVTVVATYDVPVALQTPAPCHMGTNQELAINVLANGSSTTSARKCTSFPTVSFGAGTKITGTITPL